MTDIYTTEAVCGDVQIQLTYPTRTGVDIADHDRHIAALTVTDRTSGQILVQVELSAEQYLSMMSGTGTHVSAASLPVRPDRIGMRRQNTSTAIPRTYGVDVQTRIDEVVAQYRSDGWNTEVRRTSGGHQVIARRWIDSNGNPVT